MYFSTSCARRVTYCRVPLAPRMWIRGCCRSISPASWRRTPGSCRMDVATCCPGTVPVVIIASAKSASLGEWPTPPSFLACSLFCKELWVLLASAASNPSGIPQQFLDEKLEEARQRKVEEERIQARLREEAARREAERREAAEQRVGERRRSRSRSRERDRKRRSRWDADRMERRRSGSRSRSHERRQDKGREEQRRSRSRSSA